MGKWEDEWNEDHFEAQARDLPLRPIGPDEFELEELNDDIEEEEPLHGFEVGANIASDEYWEGADE